MNLSSTTTIVSTTNATVSSTTTMDPVTALTYDLTWHGVYIVRSLF
jgi:hypothetical protein